MFDGHFCSLSLTSSAGCHVLSKAPAMSSATRQHLVPRVLALVTDLITFCMASTVDLPAVNPNCWGGISPVVSRNDLSLSTIRFQTFTDNWQEAYAPVAMYCMMLTFVRFRDGCNPGGFPRFGKTP